MSRRMAGWKVRKPTNRSQLPDKPGRYHWSEWRCVVEVIQRGKTLFVTPPGGIAVKISPFIAGTFTYAGEP